MNKSRVIDLDSHLKPYIGRITFDLLGEKEACVACQRLNEGLFKFHLEFSLDRELKQDDWQINIRPSFNPVFHWAPHLTPTENHIIDQHSFHSPALIGCDDNRMLAVIPDLDIMLSGTPVRWYMDMDAQNNEFILGMSEYQVNEHVLYNRRAGAVYPSGKVEMGFYIMVSDDKEKIFNPFRQILDFLWSNWGSKLFNEGYPLKGSLMPYVKHTYKWAFDGWKKSVWQEFDLNGKKAGAPVFIVDVTQSPNYKGVRNEREFRSIWNQAWFSSLRSAQGLFRYGKRTDNNDYIQKAMLMKELALSAPMNKGLFPSVIATEMEEFVYDGKRYNRSRGWDTLYWGNSNRNPFTRDARVSPYHILDMSFTAFLMLQWYEELEKDERLLDYAVKYGDALTELQDDKGYFPAWIDTKTLKPMGVLDESPETSMSSTFLLKLYRITNNEKYLDSALKAIGVVCKEIVPIGRWEDFETYWSCSSFGNSTHVNRKFERNNMYKQNTLSMFWTAEALYHSYKITGERKYLDYGQRCLDEMLMKQASWQPPYIYVNAVGGFGVMNCDGEWNDARQSLFAELIILYGLELNKKEYIERGLAALRASFVMMYCPENPEVKMLWEKVWPFFNEKDYGFTMENYGHGGLVNPEGDGMGNFTIFDWGNGSAAAAYMRILDNFDLDV